VRQGQWLALAAFTSVTLVAMRSRFENNLSDEKQPVKWAMSSASVVLFASTLSCVYHFLMPKKFVGTLWEGGMVRVSVANVTRARARLCILDSQSLHGLPLVCGFCLRVHAYTHTH
jgi:hypothetical protein